jgi:hypothetical protein
MQITQVITFLAVAIVGVVAIPDSHRSRPPPPPPAPQPTQVYIYNFMVATYFHKQF